MSSEKFCLKWNDFESNISVAFRDLRDDGELFDVTLACCDESTGDSQKFIQAHKVILSACSPFFRNLLRRQQPNGGVGGGGNPIIYLRGISYTDMESVLSFMYHGEVNVAQDQLNSFLAVAEDLKVKGLTQNKTQDKKPPDVRGSGDIKRSRSPIRPSGSDTLTPAKKPRRPSPIAPTQIAPAASRSSLSAVESSSSHTPEEDDDIQEVVPVKSEPKDVATSAVAHARDTGGFSAPLQGGGSHGGQNSGEGEFEDSQQDEYVDESYDDSYGQYDDQYMADASGTGQQINPGDADKGSPNEVMKKYAAYNTQINMFECTICQKTSKQQANLIKHIESVHFPNYFVYACTFCDKTFPNRNSMYNHVSTLHKREKHYVPIS